MIKNLDRWIGSHITRQIKSLFRTKNNETIHIMFGVMDHYEPDWNDADQHSQHQRVQRWVEKWPALSKRHVDADGQHPKHTFFYPCEVYTKEHLDMLKTICDQGVGEVEVHLHHDNDTAENLKKTLEQAKQDYAQHGFLGKDKTSQEIRYGFIHGNWALNNCRRDKRWCGVDNETAILKSTGCYADFTYPSAPDETQPSIINRIYYDDNELLMVQGPLTLDWKKRKKGIFPSIENAELSGVNPPIPGRIDLWVKTAVSHPKQQNWIFIKLHTHGAPEKNAEVLLGKEMDEMFHYLEKHYNDGTKFALHYVSAREMANIIKAADNSEQGSPSDFRDYEIEKNQ